MRIALVQMDVVAGDEKTNLEAARRGLARAAHAGADLAVLPELWNAGYVWREGPGYPGPRDANSFAWDIDGKEGPPGELSRAAAEFGMWIVGGSLPEATPRGVFNCAPVFDPCGRLVHRYRKVHLIGLMDEDVHMVAGEECAAFDMNGIPAGVFICYDLRFPELARNLFIDGAQLMMVPAQWPAARAAHWRSLLIARAVENQCYVVATNRVGVGGPDEFAGGSLVVAPDGGVVAEGGQGAEVVLADVDFASVSAARRLLPCLADRRPRAYRL